MLTSVEPVTLALWGAAVVFVAYLVRGIAGFGSGLIAVPLLTLAAPITVVVPIIVLLDYLGSASQGIRNRTAIAWRELWVLVPCAAVGVAIGVSLLDRIESQALAHALGWFVIGYALYQLVTLPRFPMRPAVGGVLGFLAGMVGALFNTGGPFYAIYLSTRCADKTAFRATFAANYLIDGGVRLVAYVALGLFHREALPWIAAAIPVAAAGLYLGGRVHVAIPQRVFTRFISLLLVASGSLLILRN